jgi:CoA:oxalate CoA-transferase
MTATRTGPLAGLTIVDLSRVLAGPYATMVLSDLGARVIKVERPGTGDDSRAIGPFVEDAAGRPMSAYFTAVNRAKESIALDLKVPADRAVFEALLAQADVLVENFRPGVLARLGYGWEALHARFPRLIYAAVSGFGHTGPYSDRASYDMVAQAMGGIMSITGHPGGPPTRVGTSFGDIVGGLFTVIGIQGALADRARTGAGSFLDLSMLDGQIAMLENAIVRYAVTGQSPGPMGARHPSITPFAAFRAADGHLVIAAGNDALWQTLADTLAQPAWTSDPRYATNAARCAHVDALTAELEAILTTRPVAHWLERLEAAGIPCGPINSVADAVHHPQVRARSMIVDSAFEDGTPLIVAGTPVKLSSHADVPTRPRAPKLDEHGPAIRTALTERGDLPTGALRFAGLLADASGALIRRHFRTAFAVDAKADATPVTIADREAEALLRARIAAAYPDHGVIGEEQGDDRPDAEWVWVLDPIDGTKSFVAGRPTFGTLIALLHQGVPVLGVIDQPVTGDRWIGARGQPTRFNGAEVRARAGVALAQASLATTGPDLLGPDAAGFNRVAALAGTRLWGGDCLNYGHVASGWIDLVIESGLKLHDFAALVPIVAGAGGVMTDWAGRPLTQVSDGRVIAAGSAALAAEARALLA